MPFFAGQSGKISIERLADIFLELQTKGANNINLVTPEHYAPSIALALAMAKAKGLHLPIICNCSGYSSLTALRILSDHVDVWLPDFKYYSPELSRKYSHAPDYFTVACQALQFMYEQAGDPVFDDNGIIQKGHHRPASDTARAHGGFRKSHSLSPRNLRRQDLYQYHEPIYSVSELLSDYPELNHTISASDYDALVDYAIDIGVENGFIQEGETAKESFIPPFDNEGV